MLLSNGSYERLARPAGAGSMLDDAPIVFVVDDDVSIRESLELLIRSAGWIPETYASAREFMDRPRPDVANCLVLDVNLPDLNGLDVQQLVATERTEMPIIFVTGCGDIPTTVKAMKAGAVEFLSKPLSDTILLEAIEHALERSRDELLRAAEIRMLRQRHASLTQREQQVMALVVRGLLNKQVAYELGITEITVKAHRGQVMRKMNARSLPELVHLAASLGIDCLAPRSSAGDDTRS